jgi:hypothetical protein
MLYRNNDGNLIEITKKYFYNDYLFNKKMIEIKITFAKKDRIDNYYSIKHNYSENLLNSLIPETF